MGNIDTLKDKIDKDNNQNIEAKEMENFIEDFPNNKELFKNAIEENIEEMQQIFREAFVGDGSSEGLLEDIATPDHTRKNGYEPYALSIFGKIYLESKEEISSNFRGEDNSKLSLLRTIQSLYGFETTTSAPKKYIDSCPTEIKTVMSTRGKTLFEKGNKRSEYNNIYFQKKNRIYKNKESLKTDFPLIYPNSFKKIFFADNWTQYQGEASIFEKYQIPITWSFIHNYLDQAKITNINSTDILTVQQKTNIALDFLLARVIIKKELPPFVEQSNSKDFGSMTIEDILSQPNATDSLSKKQKKEIEILSTGALYYLQLLYYIGVPYGNCYVPQNYGASYNSSPKPYSPNTLHVDCLSFFKFSNKVMHKYNIKNSQNSAKEEIEMGTNFDKITIKDSFSALKINLGQLKPGDSVVFYAGHIVMLGRPIVDNNGNVVDYTVIHAEGGYKSGKRDQPSRGRVKEEKLSTIAKRKPGKILVGRYKSDSE